MKQYLNIFYNGLNDTNKLDFLALFALRLYLAPIMWMAGTKKLENFADTVAWFGNDSWGLGLPIPAILVAFVTATEILGAIFLLFGFAVRWISMPLMLTMLGSILTVHGKNGWLAIAEPNGFFANPRTAEAAIRLTRAKEILQEHGNYDWLTGMGNFVILNNGMEFAATYLIMLLVLFFYGGGRYLSVDYWLQQQFPADNKERA